MPQITNQPWVTHLPHLHATDNKPAMGHAPATSAGLRVMLMSSLVSRARRCTKGFMIASDSRARIPICAARLPAINRNHHFRGNPFCGQGEGQPATSSEGHFQEGTNCTHISCTLKDVTVL
eukprot:1139158-Pelagomonas_calceolata.AAC.3